MTTPKSGERPATFDRRLQVDEANDTKPAVWEALKSAYDDAVVAATEVALDRSTSFAYADVNAVELAEYHLLAGLRQSVLQQAIATNRRIEEFYGDIDGMRARLRKGGRGVRKAELGARIEALEELAARARMDAAKQIGLVLKLTGQIASKLRHVRLVTDRAGGGGADMANKAVALPVDLAGKIETVDTTIDEDFLAPVVDPDEEPDALGG